MSDVYDGTVDREVIQVLWLLMCSGQHLCIHIRIMCLLIASDQFFKCAIVVYLGFSLLHIWNFSYVRVIADCVDAVKSGASDVYFNISSVITVTLRCKWSCAGSRDLSSHIYCSYIDLGNMFFILQWRVSISQWYVSIGNNVFGEVRITRCD